MTAAALRSSAFASLEAVGRVLIIFLAGVWLARRGLFNQSARGGISKLCKSAFLPALLLAKVGETLTLDALLHWYWLPVFALVYCGIGLALGGAMSSLLLGFRGGSQARRFVMAAVAFPNTTSIPLALVASLVQTATGQLREEGEDASALYSRGVSYVLFYTIWVNLLRWTLAYTLLEPDDGMPLITADAAAADLELVTTAANGGAENSSDFDAVVKPPSSSAANSNKKKGLRDRLKKVLNEPVIAALVAIAMSVIPPVRSVFWGDGAVLKPSVTDALETIGNGYVPAICMTLGANISDGPKSSDIRRSEVLVIGIAKLLLMPTIALALVAGLRGAGVLPHGNRMLIFCILLQSCGPPAINLSVICSLHRCQESKMAALLFYMYLCATLTMPFWTAVFLASL